MSDDVDPDLSQLHEERADAAARSAANGAKRADAARARAAAALDRGHDRAAAFHEEVAALHDRHQHHELEHRDVEHALAEGRSLVEIEGPQGWERHRPTPPTPTPPIETDQGARHELEP